MILQVPDVFPPDYYQAPTLYIWIVVIIFYMSSFLIFVLKGRKFELKSQKMLFMAYGIASLALGLTRIFFLLSVHIEGNYDFFTLLGYISSLAGLIFWLFILEKYMVPKTKKIFTIICVVAFSFSIVALFGFIDRSIALNIQYILLPLSLGAIFFLYLYIIVKTTGDIRTKAIWVLIGMIFIAIGQVLDGEAIYRAMPDFSLVIPPIVMIIGVLIFVGSQVKK